MRPMPRDSQEQVSLSFTSEKIPQHLVNKDVFFHPQTKSTDRVDMPTQSESKQNNRDLLLEILHTLGTLKTEISRLSIDVSLLKQKALEAEEAKKSWIW